MDVFNDDFKMPGKAKSKSYEVEYESLTHTAVEKLMQADIEHISGIFGVDVCFFFSLHFGRPGLHDQM
jgi:ariadne-1